MRQKTSKQIKAGESDVNIFSEGGGGRFALRLCRGLVPILLQLLGASKFPQWGQSRETGGCDEDYGESDDCDRYGNTVRVRVS